MLNDDESPDLADESADMSTTEGAVNASTELRKRRSTRIVQAVPLVVTGVDALGRPFAERTSTLIINCHGCRYQSKHYVLKNMWVNLEVPHSEPGHAPRRVRGKVHGSTATDGAAIVPGCTWNWKRREMFGALDFRPRIGFRSRKRLPFAERFGTRGHHRIASATIAGGNATAH